MAWWEASPHFTAVHLCDQSGVAVYDWVSSHGDQNTINMGFYVTIGVMDIFCRTVHQHTAGNSVWFLRTDLNERIFRVCLGSSRSVDLNVCDLYLCGTVTKVCTEIVHELRTFTDRNLERYSRNTKGILRRVWHIICYTSVKCSSMLQDTTVTSTVPPSIYNGFTESRHSD
jgi:hypothetical protein